MLDFVCWPETMVGNRNELSRPIASEILEKLNHEQEINDNYQPFGDGHAAEKIVTALENYNPAVDNARVDILEGEKFISCH